MRTFDDALGNGWQAAVLEASYGSVSLVFSATQGEGMRHIAMPAENLMEALAQLAGMDEPALCELLAAAEPWDRGAM